jgi:hypothetical protein
MRTRTLCAYLAAVVVPLVVAVLLLHVRSSDLRVPFTYHGDAVSFALLVKSIADHGWYLSNPDLGAPAASRCTSFPSPTSSTCW